MSGRPRPAILLQTVACIAMCSIYVTVGGHKILRTMSAELGREVAAMDPFHSTDLYLRELTGMSNGSQRFIQIFASLPPQKSVYVLVPEGEVSCSFVGAIIVYLGWPNEVRTVEVREGNTERELHSINPDSCAALIFCGLTVPSWITSGIQLGSNLIIVPLGTENKHEP